MPSEKHQWHQRSIRGHGIFDNAKQQIRAPIRGGTPRFSARKKV
jgi:hypothetical protein